MSKVSAEWDSMCTVLVVDREKFQLSVNPGADELVNIGHLLENGYVRTLVTEWLNNLPVAKIKTGINVIADVDSNQNKPSTTDLEKESTRSDPGVTHEQRSDTHGRFVVATKDLAEGATIARERAFVLVPVYSEAYVPGKSRPFCAHCASSRTQSTYDCPQCRRISYCSGQCRDQDEQRRIHRYECKGHRMGLFHDLGVSHLAVHALLAGVAKLSADAGINASSFSDLLETAGDESDAAQLPLFGYSRVLRLGANFAHMSEEDYLRFALTAVMFTFYLLSHTDFPQQDYPEPVVAALLLRHMAQIINNAHTMFGIAFATPDEPIPLGHLHERANVSVVATALFPRVAMLNHSCDPNIRNRFDGNVLTITATRPIRRNEEVFNGYCPGYKLLDRAKRRQLLNEQYGFDCECARCADNEDVLLAKYQSYICQTANCGAAIVPDANQSRWWRDADAPARPLVCAKCGRALDLGWSDAFMVLFERDVSSVQQLKWLTQDVCEAYGGACERMAALHLYKWELASMVVKLMPLAKLELSAIDGPLLDALVAVAADYMAGIGEQFGAHSLERIEASAHWMDLVARRRALTATSSAPCGELQSLRAVIEGTVSAEVLAAYARYMDNYLA